MSLNKEVLEQQWNTRNLQLTRKFGGLVKEELAKSRIMSMTLQRGYRVESGYLVFEKAGADEELQAPYTKVEFNNTSNIYDEVDIPFVLQYSTKEVRVSPEEWLQTYATGVMDEQAMRVKAQKVAKIISRIIMSIWLKGTISVKGNTLKCGDGAIPLVNFKWTTTLGTNTREEIANEFDKFGTTVFLPNLEKIRNIGFKDPITGKNAFDPYRTGVEVNNSIYSISTSQNFKVRWEMWSDRFNRSNIKNENGSYGSLYGYDLYEDIYLPLVPVEINDNWTKKNDYDQPRESLTYTETNKIIEFMFIKAERLIKGTVFDYMWEEKIPKTNGARVIGWNGRLGAGTIFPDELFVINTGENSPSPSPEPAPRKINISNIATPTASENDFIINVLDPKTATQNEISNAYKNSVLSEIKKINDSLTENDFEISTNFMGKNNINLIANSNNFVLNIKGKNNADGQKVVNININNFILKNLSDVINGDVDSPTEFKVNDPKNVMKDELINALKTEITKSIDKELSETITENDYEIVIKNPNFTAQARYDMSKPTQVKISLNGKNWLVGNSGNDINIQMPSATKK